MDTTRNRFALFDVDNTLYDGHSLFGIIEAQQHAGLLPAGSLQHIQEPHKEHQKGERDYEDMAETMLNRYAKAMRGIGRERAYKVCYQHFSETDKLFEFVQPVIDLLRGDHIIILVSAMPDIGCQAVAEVLGADCYYSSELLAENGMLTGKVGTSLTARDAKKEVVDRIRQFYDPTNSFAFGDSAGDMEMLRAVRHAVCVNPSDELRTEAEQHDWTVAQPNEVLAQVRKLTA